MPQSLHSLLMAKRSAESSPINYVRQIPGPTSPSHESDKDQKQERFFPNQGIEEKELNGTSEMVYDDSLRSPDSTISSNTTPLTENCGLSEAFLQGADQPVLRLKAAEVIVSNHQETDRLGSENEILKLQSQMYLQKISLLEHSLIDYAALREELNLRNSEVYEIKSHFRRTKQEDDDTLQQLSAENAFLRSAQIDTEISVNNAQKKYSALDGVKAELLEQVN